MLKTGSMKVKSIENEEIIMTMTIIMIIIIIFFKLSFHLFQNNSLTPIQLKH